jgi:hypothetical protein
VRVVGIPGDPREYVYFAEGGFGVGFVVPQGRRLIVTAIGGSAAGSAAAIRDNGFELLYVELAPGNLYYQIPAPGVPVESGHLVQALSWGSGVPFSGRAIGYLIDE